MSGRERLEYRRELVSALLTLSVLVIDVTMFETIRSDGESGGQPTAVVVAD
ncbi:MAG: hypothetical protein AB7D39_18665 [Pseudodesulfovibrio sp.]|uniref:hypothetical protein n=1 Tax=Pseudodesulfovibrio sp. TaxID=2035812 RepID=UPI003D14EDF9